MTTDIFKNREGVANEQGEQARRAVKAFRRMQPMLSSYARIITGRPDVRVEMAASSNGMTDGKKIYFRPPLALGSNAPHDRSLCDKRDDNLQLLCAACSVRESVLVVIYHEIGHIAYESFAKTSEADRTDLIERAIKESGGKYAEAIAARIKRAPDAAKDSYIGMSGLVSPFLPMLVNALEDARINRSVFKARVGTKVMFDADTWRIFEQGVEQKDETGAFVHKKWDVAPLNMQATVGVFCVASGYTIDGWFASEVASALKDPKLVDLCRRIDTVRTVGGSYELAFPILARLRELGFFKSDTDPETPPEEEQGTDDQAEPEGQDEPQDGEPESDDGQGADEEGQPSDPGAEEGDSSGDAEGSSGEGGEGEKPDDQDGPDGRGSESDAERDDDGDEGADTDDAGGAAEDADGEPEEGDGGGSDDAGAEASDAGADGADDASDGPSDDDDSAAEGGDGSGSEGELTDDGVDQDPAEGAGEAGGEASQEGEGDSAEAVPSDDEVSAGGSSDPSEGEVRDGDDSTEEAATQPPGDGRGSELGSSDGDDEGGEAPEPDRPMDSSGEPTANMGDGSELADARGEADRSDDVPVDGDDRLEDGDGEADDPAADGVGEPGEGESDPIDTGADEGMGGVTVIEDEANDREPLPMGTPEDVEGAVHDFAHPEERPTHIKESAAAEKEIDRAIVQGLYFETPSRAIFGVREHRHGDPQMADGYNMSQAWDHGSYMSYGYSKKQLGISGDFSPGENIIGPALLRMRVAFSDNRRGRDMRHKKSGKIDNRVLGRRAYHGDERLFKTRILPGKRDYFVLIGLDVSGSTIGENIRLIKRAAYAQAELCARMGIKFAIFAHSGNMHSPSSGRYEGLDLDIYLVKEPDEPWSPKVQERLHELGPDSANLDGHTLEYYRKVLDTRPETDRIILYYTDGKMPAENHDEELEILQREIRVCKQKNYTLLGVGIRTDSPARHGLDTVQVDGDEDIVKVVKHLEKRLVAS